MNDQLMAEMMSRLEQLEEDVERTGRQLATAREVADLARVSELMEEMDKLRAIADLAFDLLEKIGGGEVVESHEHRQGALVEVRKLHERLQAIGSIERAAKSVTRAQRRAGRGTRRRRQLTRRPCKAGRQQPHTMREKR